MHGRRLYARRDQGSGPAAEAELVRDFLADSEALERRLRATLVADDAEIARNSQLVWTWDSLSLDRLLDWAPFTLRAVPTADGEAVDVGLDRHGTLEPWPFCTRTVDVHCDGRRLAGDGYGSDIAFRQALAHAPWEPVRFRLRPATGATPTI